MADDSGPLPAPPGPVSPDLRQASRMAAAAIAAATDPEHAALHLAPEGPPLLPAPDPEIAQQRLSGIRRVTWVSVGVNAILAAAKAAAGVAGQSQALVADAVHSLSDLVTDFAVLVGAGYWTAPADPDHPHGHRKIETLVTLLIGVVLAAAGLGLAWRGLSSLIERFSDGGASVAAPSWLAFGAAVASILVKEWLYRWTLRWGQRLKSPAVVANAWHHRTDALSSVPAALAVALGALGARFGYNAAFFDPVGGVVVAVLIVQASWKIAKPALGQLLDRAASAEVHDTLRAMALAIDGVRDVHDIRTRYLGPHAIAVDLHIMVEGSMTVRDGHRLCGKVKSLLLTEGPDVVDVLIHIEPAPPLPTLES